MEKPVIPHNEKVAIRNDLFKAGSLVALQVQAIVRQYIDAIRDVDTPEERISYIDQMVMLGAMIRATVTASLVQSYRNEKSDLKELEYAIHSLEYSNEIAAKLALTFATHTGVNLKDTARSLSIFQEDVQNVYDERLLKEAGQLLTDFENKNKRENKK